MCSMTHGERDDRHGRSSATPFSLRFVSENYQLYAAKMAELKTYRSANRPLQRQVDELLMFVEDCENRWQATFWMEGMGDPAED